MERIHPQGKGLFYAPGTPMRNSKEPQPLCDCCKVGEAVGAPVVYWSLDTAAEPGWLEGRRLCKPCGLVLSGRGPKKGRDYDAGRAAIRKQWILGLTNYPTEEEERELYGEG
jgi:hypothetical protein